MNRCLRYVAVVVAAAAVVAFADSSAAFGDAAAVTTMTVAGTGGEVESSPCDMADSGDSSDSLIARDTAGSPIARREGRAPAAELPLVWSITGILTGRCGVRAR